MNFEEFKKRYIKKMEAVGYVFDESDEAFNDQMAGIYLGLMIYAEFQREEMTKQIQQQQEEFKKQQKKTSGIILPGGPH